MHLQSFVKIKSSQTEEITLPFTDYSRVDSRIFPEGANPPLVFPKGGQPANQMGNGVFP